MKYAFLSENWSPILYCFVWKLLYQFYLNIFPVHLTMSIKFILSKEGEESLNKRIEVPEKHSEELMIKKGS